MAGVQEEFLSSLSLAAQSEEPELGTATSRAELSLDLHLESRIGGNMIRIGRFPHVMLCFALTFFLALRSASAADFSHAKMLEASPAYAKSMLKLALENTNVVRELGEVKLAGVATNEVERNWRLTENELQGLGAAVDAIPRGGGPIGQVVSAREARFVVARVQMSINGFPNYVVYFIKVRGFGWRVFAKSQFVAWVVHTQIGLS